MQRVPTLVVSGPVGVGKSTVAAEVSSLLSACGVAHTMVDLDVLAATYPPPPEDRFQQRLALRNLATVWANAREVGSRNLVIARVVEQIDELAGYREAVPGADLQVVRLTAADEELVTRVEHREIGAGRSWHRERSLELARAMRSAPADRVVDTSGRSIGEVATEVAAGVEWNTER